VNTVRRRFLEGLLRIFDQALQTLSFALTTMLVVYADGHISMRDFLSIRCFHSELRPLRTNPFCMVTDVFACAASINQGKSHDGKQPMFLRQRHLLPQSCSSLPRRQNIRFITKPAVCGGVLAISSNLLTCTRLLLHHVLLKLPTK